MSSRAALAATLLALSLAACAGPQARHAQPLRLAARARFEPAAGDALFAQAVRAAALEGYRIRTCDPDRWRLETEPIEFDAPCGATTCLARQWIEVKLGYRVARVTVERELYDGAYRAWQDDDRSSSTDAARALLDRIVAGFAPNDTRKRLVPVRDRTAALTSPDPGAASRFALVARAAPLP